MIKFPIVIEDGKVAKVSNYQELIEQSIKSLLMESEGSNFFDRSYGSLLKQCLFEPISEVGLARLQYFARQVLSKEKRINVQRIEIDDSNKKDGVVKVNIFYNIIATNSNSNITLQI